MRREMSEQPQEVSEPSAAAARGVPPRPPPHPTAQDALFAPPPRGPPAAPAADPFGPPPPRREIEPPTPPHRPEPAAEAYAPAPPLPSLPTEEGL